jgi:hypothetical protein
MADSMDAARSRALEAFSVSSLRTASVLACAIRVCDLDFGVGQFEYGTQLRDQCGGVSHGVSPLWR